MTCPTADDLEPTERGREDRPEGFSMSRRTEEEKDIENGKRGRRRERRREGERGRREKEEKKKEKKRLKSIIESYHRNEEEGGEKAG